MRSTAPTPAVSQVVSIAIHRLRAPLMLAVVMLHTLPWLRIGTGPFWQMAEQALRFARPLFFFCAAYLLFRHWRHGWPAYRQLVQHRLLRLGLPLLSWGLLLYVAYSLLLQFGPAQWVNHPAGAHAGSVSEFIALILGINRNPLAYQLWFLRDLLLLTLLAPLFYLLWHLLRFWLALGLVLLYLFQHWPWFQPALVSTVFFGLGAVAALSMSTFRLSGLLFYTLLPIWGALLYCATGTVVVADAAQVAGPLSVLAGALWVWNLLLRIAAKSKQQLEPDFVQQHSDQVFFVFAAHEPLLTLFGKCWHQWVSEPAFDILLLGLPFLLYCLLSLSYRRLVRPLRLLSLFLLGRR